MYPLGVQTFEQQMAENPVVQNVAAGLKGAFNLNQGGLGGLMKAPDGLPPMGQPPAGLPPLGQPPAGLPPMG